MRGIHSLLILLFLTSSAFSLRAQVPPPAVPPPASRPIVVHAPRQIAPDTLLKDFGDSVAMKMMARDYIGALHYCNLRIRKTPFRMQFMYYDRAQAETYLGKNDDAIRDYDTVIGLDSSAAAAYMNQAYLYMQTNNTKKAMVDYKIGLEKGTDSTIRSDMYLSRGNAYLSLKQPNDAEADFTNSLTYNPHSWQSWLQRGAVRRLLKDNKNALADLEQAYKLKPADPDVLLLRGILLFENGKYPESVDGLKEALKVRKNNQTWFYLGLSEMKIGNDSIAREYFSKFIKNDPKNAMVWNNCGEIDLKMKHPMEAIKDYTKVIQLKPKSGEAYANRAYVYSQIGERDKACADLHKAEAYGVKKAKDIIKNYCGGK